MASNNEITFCNFVLGRGVLNGVVNVTLGAFLFDPNSSGEEIDPTPVVVSRLRMDVACARRLRDALASILEAVDNPDKAPHAAANGDGTAAPAPVDTTAVN
jgi:hypothetical protein